MRLSCATTIAFLVIFLSRGAVGAAQSWEIDRSIITYTVHHPLKTASGTSKDTKGKGQCADGRCKFIIATPVKSFDSGDSNRDLHMIEVTRGGENPMIVVRTAFDESSLTKKLVPLTFEIEFAGKRAAYHDVPFEIVSKDPAAVHVKGTILIKLSDFFIVPPSLLAISIKDEVPVTIDSFWRMTSK